jgi:flavin reductase (DIM6/NTAB) family NADH-FMN oxidoreductase RutF
MPDMDEQRVTIDPRRFREVCGQYATGVAVVTACGGQGRSFGVTVNSFTSVSLDPPLVQFSLDRKASVFPIFIEATHFVINVLSTGQRQYSSRFALRSDAFEEVVYAAGMHGCPVLEGCIANIECEKYAVYDGGDHVIILGRVMHLHCAPGNEPLLFFRGGFGTFT